MFWSFLIELIFKVNCNYYGNLLAELLPVFYCRIYKIFLQWYNQIYSLV